MIGIGQYDRDRDVEMKYTFAAILFVLGGMIVSVRGQNPDDVVRVDTELVAFEVTVSDKNGNPVRNLQPGDFKIIEDGAERRPDFFQPIVKSDLGRPLSIVFTLDVSGSMTPQEL